MEILLSLAVLLVLLLVLGVDIATIFLGSILLIYLAACMLSIHYLCGTILSCFGKRCRGNFVELKKKGILRECAVYLVGGEEIPCYYVAETCWGVRDLVYRKDRLAHLRILTVFGKTMVFDYYGRINGIVQPLLYVGIIIYIWANPSIWNTLVQGVYDLTEQISSLYA